MHRCRLVDRLLSIIAACSLSGKTTEKGSIFYNMAYGNNFDSGAGISFAELVNLASEKGLVQVTTAADGAQYLYLVAIRQM
jgi:hypothetical protein